MSDVVTIFSCGTAASHADNDAIPFTHGLTTGRKWINDGPGSKHAPKKVEAILKRVEAGKDVPDAMFSAQHKSNGLGGKLFGTGTQDNIVLSLQWLWEEYYAQPFRTVNLAGWSRGAVTSIMLAHAMQEAGFGGKGVRVNVFAIDPVPGLANDFHHKGTFDTTGRIGDPKNIPPIVNQYEAVLMEHVDGWLGLKPFLFKSVSPHGAGTATLQVEHPLPGSHVDCVVHNDTNNPVGKVAAHLLHDHLIRNGTQLRASSTRSPRALLELYAGIRLQFSRRVGNRLVKVRAQRVRAHIVANQFRGDVFFVNGHHYTLFRDTLPGAWSQMERNQPLTAEMQAGLQRDCPRTFHALEAAGVI